VLDEADELITKDSLEHIQTIFGRLLAANVAERSGFHRLQVCFFSATLHSPAVRDLASKLCSHPLWVDLRGTNDSIVPDTVHHCVVKISPSSYQLSGMKTITTDAVHRQGKLEAPVSCDDLSETEADSEKIKQLKPQVVLDLLERFSMEQVLIFCRTNLDCDLMERFFRNAGSSSGSKPDKMTDKYSCRVLAGMRSMPDRQKALKDFKEGEVRILIATDVAARGIDIRELPFVINMTLPDSPETYVHRTGRVGRADRMGLAISLVSTVKERVWFCRSGKPPVSDTSDYDKGGTTRQT
jgi:ATP-dependent RNA helicase DDX1